jgi:phosphonate transport system substrate-binding protein
MTLLRLLLQLLPILAATTAGAEGYKPSGSAVPQDAYIVGIHPYTNPQELFEAYDPVLRYLEHRIPGVRFRFEASRDYADFETKLAERRFHFALPNPAQAVVSLSHGYRVIAKMTPDEDFRGLVVARGDRAVAAPRELAGKTLCFPSPTAVAGTMLPLLYLHEHGLDVKRDVQIHYVGSQFSSIVNAHSGEFAACGSTARFWRVWARDNPDKAREMKVLWRTPSLPHNAFVARADVAPELARRVTQALAAMARDTELEQSQFRLDQQHFEPAGDAAYKPLQEFLQRYDRAIGLPAAMKLQGNREQGAS